MRTAGVSGLVGLLSAACSLALDFDGPLLDARPGVDSATNTMPTIDALPRRPDAAPDLNEPNDSPAASATPIAMGSLSGRIDPAEDVDYFRFTLAAPAHVTIVLKYHWLDGDIDVELLDTKYKRLTQGVGLETDDEVIEWDLADSGDYFIKVFSYQMIFTNGYTVQLTIL